MLHCILYCSLVHCVLFCIGHMRCTILTHMGWTYIRNHTWMHTHRKFSYTKTHLASMLVGVCAISHYVYSNGACSNQFSTAGVHQVCVLLRGWGRRLNEPARYPAMLLLIWLKIPLGGWPQKAKPCVKDYRPISDVLSGPFISIKWGNYRFAPDTWMWTGAMITLVWNI